MSGDIVERLQYEIDGDEGWMLLIDAKAEIERLRAEVGRLNGVVAGADLAVARTDDALHSYKEARHG